MLVRHYLGEGQASFEGGGCRLWAGGVVCEQAVFVIHVCVVGIFVDITVVVVVVVVVVEAVVMVVMCHV